MCMCVRVFAELVAAAAELRSRVCVCVRWVTEAKEEPKDGQDNNERGLLARSCFPLVHFGMQRAQLSE